MPEDQEDKTAEAGADEYQKTYYERHRAKIKSKRAERYAANPGYQEAAKKRAKAQRQRAKEKRAEVRLARGEEPSSRLPAPRMHLVDIDGSEKEIELHSAGQLGKRLGRSTQTIRIWERKQILPKAMYRDPGTNARLYTALQVEKLVAALKLARKSDGHAKVRERISASSFPRRAQEIWEKWPNGIETGE